MCPLLCFLAVTVTSFGRVLFDRYCSKAQKPEQVGIILPHLVVYLAYGCDDGFLSLSFFFIYFRLIGCLGLTQTGGSLRVSIFNPLPTDAQRLQADAGIHEMTRHILFLPDLLSRALED